MWKKLLIGLGVGTGALAAINYFRKLSRASAELQSVSSMQVHKLDLSGLTLRVDVKLKNPTAASFKLKFPFVKLIYKDAVIGSSQAVNTDISLPAYGEAVINQIMINIPIVGMFSLGMGLFQSLTKGEAVKMNTQTLTSIDLGWKKIPYEKTEEITLKK